MNMIEKVGRAQAAACSDCKKLGKVDWEAHLEDARAAIAAMCEPSEEMLKVAQCGDVSLSSVYVDMIDAALKE